MKVIRLWGGTQHEVEMGLGLPHSCLHPPGEPHSNVASPCPGPVTHRLHVTRSLCKSSPPFIRDDDDDDDVIESLT